MNTPIKIGIAFLAGAITGGLSVYFLTREKFAKEVQKEVNEYREVARRRIREAESFAKKQENIEEESIDNYSQASNSYDEFVDYCQFYDGDIDIQSEIYKTSELVNDNDFDKHIAEREFPHEEGDEDPDEIEDILSDQEKLKSLKEARRINKEPYPIDSATFHNTNQWYEKLTFTYFADNDVLTDDREIRINNVDDIVGNDDWKKFFGVDNDDPDVVLIRNEQRGCDYEICRVFDSYEEDDILKSNIDEEEPDIRIS